jgi:hypothetical protein
MDNYIYNNKPAKGPNDDLKAFNIVTNLPLPDTFIAHVAAKGDLYVVSKENIKDGNNKSPSFLNSLINKKKPGKPKEAPKPATEPKGAQPAVVIPPAEKDASGKIVLNRAIISNIISSSINTYYFTDLKQKKSDVTITIVSATKWEGKLLLKYNILNDNQSVYFFINNISVYKNSEYIIAETYSDYVIPAGKTNTGYIVLNDNVKTFSIVFIENAGNPRSYRILVNVP